MARTTGKETFNSHCSTERIRYLDSIKNDSGLGAAPLLQTIIAVNRTSPALRRILSGHLDRFSSCLYWKVKMLEFLAKLVHCTRDNHQRTEELLFFAVTCEGRPDDLYLTSDDVVEALRRFEYERGHHMRWKDVLQDILDNGSPGLFREAWEMQRGLRHLPEVPQEVEDAEDEDEDYEDFKARRIGDFISSRLAQDNEACPSAGPGTPEVLLPPTPPPDAPTRKRRRGSDDKVSPCGAQKSPKKDGDEAERPIKKPRTTYHR